MSWPLDPSSPIPLYHQIAEAVRYRIAIGALRPGDRLPSVREAADTTGVHYLTVRKAYQALEEAGLVSMRRGVGTMIAGAPGPTDSTLPIHVLECTALQTETYAAQIADALGVEVGTWVLNRTGSPPPGLLIGTYFHFNEIRSNWPARAADVRFVAVEIDPGIREQLGQGDVSTPTRVRICETDASRAHNAIPDLTILTGAGRFVFETLITDDPGLPLEDPDPALVLYAPRLWARLEEEQRRDPRSVQLRYVITDEDLATLRMELARGPVAIAS